MNQIENENKDPLIGEVECPSQKYHLFKSVSAMADFIEVFKISNGQFRSGVLANGEPVVELVYVSYQE